VRVEDLRAAAVWSPSWSTRNSESLPPATFGHLRSQELILAKTADRSVLGCMNYMAFL
jgi:hypothetical protein